MSVAFVAGSTGLAILVGVVLLAVYERPRPDTSFLLIAAGAGVLAVALAVFDAAAGV